MVGSPRTLEGAELEHALLSLSAAKRCCGDADRIRQWLEVYRVTASPEAIDAALEAMDWEVRRGPALDSDWLIVQRGDRVPWEISGI